MTHEAIVQTQQQDVAAHSDEKRDQEIQVSFESSQLQQENVLTNLEKNSQIFQKVPNYSRGSFNESDQNTVPSKQAPRNSQREQNQNFVLPDRNEQKSLFKSIHPIIDFSNLEGVRLAKSIADLNLIPFWLSARQVGVEGKWG